MVYAAMMSVGVEVQREANEQDTKVQVLDL